MLNENQMSESSEKKAAIHAGSITIVMVNRYNCIELQCIGKSRALIIDSHSFPGFPMLFACSMSLDASAFRYTPLRLFHLSLSALNFQSCQVLFWSLFLPLKPRCSYPQCHVVFRNHANFIMAHRAIPIIAFHEV